MSFKLGDRVSENGRLGVVKAIHSKGTVDVLFDDMSHVIRRQEYNVKKVKQNPNKCYPLIIACGGKKNAGPLPVNQKYAAGWWDHYRRTSPHVPNQHVPVYVLSAKYGILPETAIIDDYDMVLVKDGKKTLNKNEKRIRDIVPQLPTQLEPQTVYFAGGKIYAEALRRAGFTVILPQNMPEFPKNHIRAGSGKINIALRWLISEYIPKHCSVQSQSVLTVARHPSGGYYLAYNGGMVDIDGVFRWRLKRDLVQELNAAGFSVNRQNVVTKNQTSTSSFESK